MRRVVYFLHVPKCGGTTFVALARRAARPFSPHRNGNPLYADGTEVRFWEWDAATQLRFLTAGPHDFVANETGLGPDPPWSDKLACVTILRDPLDRALSDWRHGRLLGWGPESFGERVRAGTRRDNLMTRMLAGVPLGQPVGRGHLDLALERLDRFDEVLLVSRLAEGLVRMRRHGWRVRWPRRFRSGSRFGSDARAALREDPEALGALEEQERFDLALYACRAGASDARPRGAA